MKPASSLLLALFLGCATTPEPDAAPQDGPLVCQSFHSDGFTIITDECWNRLVRMAAGAAFFEEKYKECAEPQPEVPPDAEGTSVGTVQTSAGTNVGMAR